ncbi:hypothetical protein L1049_010309 [Liquidambar formosana]|uniref:Pentatricopeptide repeat-containing protein n=1 Tax=Liquidambar formosana TaxID=63359 RepID=A0AAP0N7C3_LIQFO
MKNGRLSTIKPLIISSTHNHKPMPPPNQTFVPENDYISHPAATSLSSALQHYINSEFPQHGQKIHSHILKLGLRPNTNICIKLLILHLKSCCLRYARQMFDEMHQRTVSAYNYMISGYIKHEKVEESLSLVRRMAFSGEKPDGYTFSMILKASTCGSSALSLSCSGIGKQVHAQILKSDVEPDDVLSTVLVDSYVKSGKVGYARTVFDLMLKKNVICSTSMISGYMNQGIVEDAEYIFNKTVEKDVVVFNAMIEGYSKSIETARRSLEAWEFVLAIPEKPNSDVWAALLSSCRLHGDVEMASIAANEVFELNANGRPGAYVALSNTLAAAGKWDNVSELRELMKARRISKDTGFSWVGTDGG